MKRLLPIIIIAMLLPLPVFAGESGVAPNVISLPDGPGSIAGLGEEFESEGNTGTATYGITLDVPPGSGGFKPSLTIRYDGGRGNSALGFGWSLPLPRIQRQTDKGLPRYDGTDTYIYQDGSVSEELVPLADGSFRLKTEGQFIRAVKDGAGWEVRTRSGVIYHLGGTLAARVHDDMGTRTFAWNITEAMDTNGNRITYEWFSDGGQSYLSKVIYNDYGSSAVCEINFTYVGRLDALNDYRATFPVTTALRLSTIELRRGGRLVRSYVLTYDQDNNILSRISGITMKGSDDTTQMPPLTFAYTPFLPADQSVVEMQNPPGRALADPNNALVDLNGDSLPDLISTSSGDHRYYINEDGIGWTDQCAMTASPSYELSQDGVRLADLDGDGVSDLIVARGVDGNSYYSGTGDAGWLASVPFDQNPVGFQLEDDDTKFVDLNGDRLIDVIRTNSTGVNAWIHQGEGAYERIGSLPRIDDSMSVMLSDPQIRLADLNGDGLIDVMRLRSQSLIYWPSMGYGYFDSPRTMSGVPQINDETRYHIVDLNGDGLADIVYVGVSNVGYWLNRADGSFGEMEIISGTPSIDPVLGTVQFADMNGNGTTDIVWVDVSDGPAGSWQYLDPIGDEHAGLINRIDNGLGKVVGIEYSSSTAQMISAARDGDPWESVIPFPVQVIGRITVNDSLGLVSVKEYSYRDGYYDGVEREFRGFAKVTARELGDDSIDDLVASRSFDVGRIKEALKSRVLVEELGRSGGVVLRKTESDWSATVLENGTDGREVVFPALDSTVVSHIETAGATRHTRIDYIYDSYGNVTDELNHGEVTSPTDDGSVPWGDDEIFIHRDFAINEYAWILDRVARERVRDGYGNRVSDKLYYYDGAVFQGLSLGQVDRGNLTREEVWLDTEDRFISVKRMRRDEWGNVTAVLDANDGRREIFYDIESHTYPVRERIFTGSYALDFVAAYDDVFGKLISLTDPNAVTTSYGYDVLGRIAFVVKPGDSQSLPTEKYTYELGAPISIITVSKQEIPGQPGTLDSFSYVDGLGRTRAELIEEEDGDFTVTKAVGYNARGKESFVAEPFRCGSSCQLYGDALTSRAGTRMFYDVLERVTQTINPDGTNGLIEYRPMEQRVFDENDADLGSEHHNTPTTKRFDGQGRLVSVAIRDGTKDLVTGFGYDAAGNLTSIVDPAGNARNMVYDSMGHMVAQDDPNAGHRDYRYDDVGNLVEKIKPDGRGVKFIYETTTNRVLAKNLVETPDDDTWEVKYHYDVPSSGWDRHGDYLKGRLAWVEDAAGAEYYGYDMRGRVATKRRTIGDDAFDFASEYDSMDRTTGMTYPDGSSITTAYNARGLVASVGEYLTDRTYNAAGQVEAEVLGGGVARSYTYDDRRRVTDIATTSATGEVIQQFGYTFDAASNVTRIDDLRVGVEPSFDQTQDFSYDDLYRLTSADLNVGSISWNYDEVGNITGKSSTLDDARFNVPDIRYGENGAGPYAVTTHGEMTLTYDANGNLISMPGQNLSYDAEDRLIAVDKDDGTIVAMVYDFDGQRKIKGNNIYVSPEYEVRDGIHYKYIWADGKRIARVQTSSVASDGVIANAAYGKLVLSGASPSNPLAMSALICAVIMAMALRRQCYRFTIRRVAAYALALVFMISTFGGATGCMGSAGKSVASLTAQEGTIYYISDHLGSSHLITDSLGNVIREESRFPYGLERQVNGESVADHVYTGKEYDEETGLVYFGGRYYSPQWGRWITPDPLFLEKEPEKSIERPLSYNLYAYVRNNPMTYTDLQGWIENERDMFPGTFPEPYEALVPNNAGDRLVGRVAFDGLALLAGAAVAAPLYAAAAPVVGAAYTAGSIEAFGLMAKVTSVPFALQTVEVLKGSVSGISPGTQPKDLSGNIVSALGFDESIKKKYGFSILDKTRYVMNPIGSIIADTNVVGSTVKSVMHGADGGNQ